MRNYLLGIPVALILSFMTGCATSAASPGISDHAHAAGEAVQGGESSSVLHGDVQEGKADSILHGDIQEITTSYAELWSSDTITVKAGVPVRWYVEAAPGSLPKTGMACGKTIKIPGLGWGTDAYNQDEGHLTLVEGKNLVYEFTPSEAGDILFTCWMGSECHSNYIHVTADGALSEAGQSRGNGVARNSAFRYRVHSANKLQA